MSKTTPEQLAQWQEEFESLECFTILALGKNPSPGVYWENSTQDMWEGYRAGREAGEAEVAEFRAMIVRLSVELVKCKADSANTENQIVAVIGMLHYNKTCCECESCKTNAEDAVKVLTGLAAYEKAKEAK